MPSGPKKRRASKRKKEVETILDSRDVTVSQDVIDNTSSINDANLGDYPVAETCTAVDSPVPEDKSVKGYIKAIPDEAEVVSPNQDEQNMLPLVDTKEYVPSSIVSDLKDKKEIFAQIHEKSLEDNYKEKILIVNDDNVEKCLKESEGDTLNMFSQKSSEELVLLDDASAEIMHGLGPKANYEVNFLQTNDDQARNTNEAGILEIDNTKSTSATHQNPLVGILSHKEIAVEEENVGNDGKILNITEQVNCLKKTIEEVLIATNNSRELLVKVLDAFEAIQSMME